MQAVSGIADIGPMTFAELLHACRAKSDFEWIQTSSLMARIANCHLGRHQRPFKAENFYRPQLHRSKKRSVMSVERLHGLFGAIESAKAAKGKGG